MQNRYQETFETWNKLASVYQEKFMDLELYNETYDFISQSLPSLNPRILEVGCGPGNITKYLLSKRPDFDILGIDIAPNMVELAERNNPTGKFAIMDIRKINELKSTFDGIVCGFCLPYLSETDVEKLIFDSSKLLNDRGLIYISFVEGEPEKSKYQVSKTGDRSFFYFHKLEKLEANLVENSFEILKVFKIIYKRSETEVEIHTILTARKN